MLHTSTLEEVTVFSQGALCVRRIQVRAENGRLPERVRVEGLPLTLEPGKLRASVFSGPAELLVRDLKADFAVREASPTELPAAKAEVERAEAHARRLEAQCARVKASAEQLSRVRPRPPPQTKGAPPRPAAIEGVLALAATVDAELAALDDARQKLERELAQVNQELAHWRRVLLDAVGAGRQTVIERAVEISLSPAEGALAELRLEYAVPGARWVPTYALALEPGHRAGRLEVRAQVSQRTGEDWSGVKLSVSTADLLRRFELPVLRSLRIGRAQPPPPVSGWRAPPTGLDALLADFRAQLAPPPPPPGPPPALATRAITVAQAPMAPPALEERLGARFDEEDEVDRPEMERDEAPPPPPSAGAPAPTMAMPRSRSRVSEESSKLKEKRRSLGGPAPKMSASLDRGGGGAEDEAEGEALVSESSAPPDAWLDYGRLTLAGPFEPSPGKLGRRADPGEAPRLRSALAGAESHARRAAESPLPPMAVAVRAQRFDDRYDALHPVSVPQDGRWHTVTLFTADAAFAPELVSVPSLDPRVYRSLELKNRSRHALLEGPADVTVGGMFLATVALPAIAPGGVERVGLGVEEAVQVSRNVRYREETGGLLGGTTLLVHEIDIEVVNRLSSPISITVRERVPVSDDHDVTVEELTQSPPWRNTSTEPPLPVEGGRAWTVAVPAGARQALEAKLQIRIPSGRTLVGGNRRF